MLYCPRRSPDRASSRLLGRRIKSRKLAADSRTRSRFSAWWRKPSNRGTLSPSGKSWVFLSRKLRITYQLGRRFAVRQAYSISVQHQPVARPDLHVHVRGLAQRIALERLQPTDFLLQNEWRYTTLGLEIHGARGGAFAPRYSQGGISHEN